MELQLALKKIVDDFATETDTQTLITIVPFADSYERDGRRYFGIKVDDNAELTDVKLGAVLHSGLMAEDAYSGLETDLLYELGNTARHEIDIPGGHIIWFCGLTAIPDDDRLRCSASEGTMRCTKQDNHPDGHAFDEGY